MYLKLKVYPKAIKCASRGAVLPPRVGVHTLVGFMEDAVSVGFGIDLRRSHPGENLEFKFA